MMATVLAMSLMTSPVIPAPPVPADQRQYMQCVATRESEGDPSVVSPTGKYRGKFQFNAPLARGATWHILPWLRTWHPTPRKYAAELRRTPMNRWPERVQDAAFIFTLNHNGVKWSGKRHWYGGRWAC